MVSQVEKLEKLVTMRSVAGVTGVTGNFRLKFFLRNKNVFLRNRKYNLKKL